MDKILICRVALFFYAVIMVVIGWKIWQKEQKEKNLDCPEFWLASRSLPGWRVGVSLAAGWLMLGWLSYGMSMIYKQGLTGVWYLALPWLILIVLIFLAIPFVRRLKTISLPTAMKYRFGKTTCLLTALCSIFVFTSWMGAELATAGRLISPFLGLSAPVCMAIFIVPILIYSFLGGFRAVVITDIVQFSMMVIFMGILLFVGFSLASQSVGPEGIISSLKSVPTKQFGEGSMFKLFSAGYLLPAILLLAFLPGWLVEQDLVLRVQAAKSLREAYKGVCVGSVLLIILVIVVPAILAFWAILIFNNPQFATPENLAILGNNGEQIITALISIGCNPFLQIIMFVGIVAIQMSTVDSFANITSLAISHDIVEPYCLKRKDEIVAINQKRKVLWARNISILTVVLGLIYAVNNDTLAFVYNLSSGVLTASVAIPIFAMFIPWVRPLGANLCVIFGFLGNIIFFYFEYYVLTNCVWEGMPNWLAGVAGYNYMLFGIIMAILGLVIGSLIGKKSSKEQLTSISKKPIDGIKELKY